MSANNDPATGVILITPGPNNIQSAAQSAGTQGIRGFYVNVAGDVTYTASDGTQGVVTALAGYIYPIRLAKVTAATATGIYGLL